MNRALDADCSFVLRSTAPRRPARRLFPGVPSVAFRLLLAMFAVAQCIGNSRELQAQSVTVPVPAVPPAGKIRGVLFDSLLMRPIARTTVMLMGTGRTATSDDKGRFGFDEVPLGQHTVAASAPVFDSLGLGTIGGVVDVRTKDDARVSISTPSLRTLWNRFCKGNNIVGTDSSIVWGTIRDAGDDSLLTGAAASFEWYHMQPGTILGITINEVRRETLTDVTGSYFACGLPDDIVISTEAVGSNAASGRVEYSVGARRLRRIDMVVSADMVLPDSVQLVTHDDSVKANRPRGKALLRGRIVDEKGKAIANAIVTIASVDTVVRTNDEGRFSLDGLPAGTHDLHVRRVGSAPAQRVIALRSGAVNETEVVMSSVTTLATMNVKGASIKGQDRLDYELRRKQGIGYALSDRDLARSMDMHAALFTFPGLRVERTGFGVSAAMRSVGVSRGECPPTVYLDGMQTPIEMATSLPMDKYRAVEVVTRPGMVPAEFYMPGGCGIILLWTKQARW